MENFKDLITKIVILGISLSLLWVIHTYIKPNQNDLQDHYPLELPSKPKYETYFIKYGPLGSEINFKGFIEFEKTTKVIITNNNTKLLVKHLSFINSGDKIAIADGIDIISDIDGYVLNIDIDVDIVIDVIEYQDIVIKSSIQLVDFIRLNMDNNFKIYIGKTAIDIKLNSWYFDCTSLKYVLEFSNLPSGMIYLHNNVINISQDTILKSVYSIPNFLLTNEVEPNKYELLIYNPTLRSNNVYSKIIEIIYVPGYSNSEIISNNLELYEQIIFNNELNEDDFHLN